MQKAKKVGTYINPFYNFLIKGFIFYVAYFFIYEYVLTRESSFELEFINLQVMSSSIFLKLIGFDVIYNENILFIRGSKPVEIMPGCNFFMNLNNFIFFFISFPTFKKRIFKYISLSLVYLSVIQILRIISFAICLKYFPKHWNIFHDYSSYLFYYPGTLTLWYFYSLKPNVNKS